MLRGHEGDPAPSALALRLMGAVHRLQYLPDDERERFEHTVRTGPGSVAWLRMEPADELTDVRLALFPGGEERLPARAGYHGDPVIWLDQPSKGLTP